MQVIVDYIHMLQRWQDEYAPQPGDDELHPLFVEGTLKQEYAWYLMSQLDDSLEHPYFYDLYHKEIEEYERRIKDDRLDSAHE
ncbi:MAG: hypothetical protein Q4C54_09940 [Clostridia bacterium]|nr:hypothetical protein [Clostridia bacterium]